jgi:hypothetical protein
MWDLLAGLVAVIVEGIVKVFTSAAFVKAIVAAFVYALLFSIIPLLIQFLVPSAIMNGLSSYVTMLQGGPTSLACSGTGVVTSGTVVSCSTVVTMVQWGQGIAYILNWFQFGALCACFLPALAVRFLFRRI